MLVNSLPSQMPLNDDYIRDAVDMLGRQATAEQIAAHFDSLRAAEVVAARDHAQAERRAGYSQGLKHGCNLSKFLGGSLVVAIAGAALTFVVWLCFLDAKLHLKQMDDCKAGDTLGCIAGVADQERGYAKASRGRYRENADNARWHRDRIQLLRAAYKLKTGQELPAIGESAALSSSSGSEVHHADR